jgi:hypothetical protein
MSKESLEILRNKIDGRTGRCLRDFPEEERQLVKGTIVTLVRKSREQDQTRILGQLLKMLKQDCSNVTILNRLRAKELTYRIISIIKSHSTTVKPQLRKRNIKTLELIDLPNYGSILEAASKGEFDFKRNNKLIYNACWSYILSQKKY